ncbi:hypothetical protein HK407_08g13490 [Ordospora pajunii]|uniref:uncharacterized protein n=1 Tax=Ordospora pajunii TaxID=3039483 RepID=UPI002952790D|nr:uncharacterized protein HK407_08g13490 [Ordospora pajunii]KAH9411075.1 hypothetical protein HK407_08g13490 [Ordospora pajunii]
MLPQDERKRMVFKLFTALKNSNIFPGYDMGQIKEAAIRAEQRIFEESKTKDEYVKGMDERFKRIEKAASEGRRDHRYEQKQETPCSVSDSWAGRVAGSSFQELNMHNSYEGDGMFSGSAASESGVLGSMQNGNQDWFGSIRNANMQMHEEYGILKDGMPQKYISQEMGSVRHRSNSCTIQKTVHKSYGTGAQEFGAGFQYAMNFSGDLAGNDKLRNSHENIQHINEERRMSAAFEQQPSSNGYCREGAYMAMQNEVDRNQEYLKYNMKSGECRSKSEVFIKPPIMRNEEKGIMLNPNYLHAGKYFIPQKHSEQRMHLQNNMYASQMRAGSNCTSSGYTTNNRMHSNMMNGNQGIFQESTLSSNSYQNRRGRGANTFLASSSNGTSSMADGWMGFSSVFGSKANVNGRKHVGGERGMKSSPIFFSQQVQHQQYYGNPQKYGETGPMHTNSRPSMTMDLSQRFEKQLGQMDIFDDSRTRLNESMHKTDYYFNGISKGMEMPGVKSERNAEYINMQSGVDTDASYAETGLDNPFKLDYLQSNMNNPHSGSKVLHYSRDSRDCSSSGVSNYGNQYTSINNSNPGCKNDSLDCNASPKLQASTNGPGYAANEEHKKELPPEDLADIDEFMNSNGLKKVPLNSLEILNMELKLEKGVNAISRSLKIYSSFEDAFPKSKLKAKYKHAKTLIEKQIECMKYNIYFLKIRNVDGLIDQINSLIVDMSHELRSTNDNTTIINYGDCLRDALKAYSEKKKRLNAFGLNLIEKNKN